MIEDGKNRSVGVSAEEAHAERRRSRRRAMAGAFVAVEAPKVAPEFCWAGSGIDINADGMGLVLPAEVKPGDEVLLTFRLDADRGVERAPSVVVRHEGNYGVGAVRFAPWPDTDRLALVSYLIEN